MELTLISPYDMNVAYGLRKLAAYLKANGHKVNVVFLSLGEYGQDFSSLYSEEIISDLVEICSSSSLVGISLMTNYFLKSAFVTRKLKSALDVSVIWGGIHPTIRSAESLKFADYIMVGECEDSFLQLVNKLEKGEDVFDVPNLGFIKDGNVVVNEVCGLSEDLDKFPMQDYDISSHYAIRDDRLVKVDVSLLKSMLPKRGSIYEYYTHTTRGCPHSCTYCCNFRLREFYKGRGKYLRKRSVEHVISELEYVKKEMEFVSLIIFTDDTFLIRSLDELKEFATLYKSRIGIPFEVYTSPSTTSNDKLEVLVDAGLVGISMGIQSGSHVTNFEIYERFTTNDVIMKAAKVLNVFCENFTPIYHIIVNNAFENNKSVLETIDLVLQLPKPYKLIYFPLVLYPGTKLYDRAKSAGMVKNDLHDVYLKTWDASRWREYDYVTYLLYLIYYLDQVNRSLARVVFGILGNSVSVFVLDNIVVSRFLYYGMRIGRWVKNLRKRS